MLLTNYRVKDTVKRAQIALQQNLRELEQIIALPDFNHVPELRLALKSTLRQATEFFRVEESDGYMHPVLEQDQRFESDVECMRDQHRELSRDLELLVDEADEMQMVDRDFCDKVCSWIDRFRKHEKREIDLVQEAFDVDVGGEGG